MPTLSLRINTTIVTPGDLPEGYDSNQEMHFFTPLPTVLPEATYTLRFIFINGSSFGTNRRSGLWVGVRFPQFPNNQIVSNTYHSSIDSVLRFPLTAITRTIDEIIDLATNVEDNDTSKNFTGTHTPNIKLGTVTLSEGYLHTVFSFRNINGELDPNNSSQFRNFFKNASIILEYN